MTREKMILKIESYVKLLSDNENKKFNYACTHFKEKDWEEVSEIDPLYGLAAIVQSLKNEIKEAATKQKHGNDYVRRSKFINKLLNKCELEQYKTGYISTIQGEETKCVIIDGYYGFAFKPEAVDIPIADDNIKRLDLNRFFENFEGLKKAEFDLSEIKFQYKMHKPQKKKSPYYININGKDYNGKFFINLCDGLGGQNIEFYQSEKYKTDIMKSENGYGFICPVLNK